jgi:two-component system, NarL family, nitrate/nitrite response regulator NarL
VGAANARPLVAILGGVDTLAAEALVWVLTESGNRVAGIYPDASAFRAGLGARVANVQIVLVDAEDPESGVAVLPDLRRAYPLLKVLLLCDTLSPAILRCALEERVEGVVLKSDSVEEVILAFKHVLEGRAVMPAGWQTVPVESAESTPVESLSPREREVLELAVGGMSNKEIAERLTISPNTVKFHLRTIYSRLGVRNRVQAMQAVDLAPVKRIR